MTRSILLIILLLFAGCGQGLRYSYRIETPPAPAAVTGPVEQLWQNRLKAWPNRVMMLNDAVLLVGDSNGGLTTLDAQNGDRTDRYWKAFKRPVQLYGNVDSVLYFSSETGKKIMAWDLKNAAKLWEKEFDVDYDEMIVADSVLFGKSDSLLAKIDAAAGKTLLTNKVEKLTRGFAGTGDRLYVCSKTGHLKAFDKNLKNAGDHNLRIDSVAGLSHHGELLIAHNSRGSVRIFSLQKNQLEFSQDFNARLYAAPRLVNNHLIVPFAAGNVVAYSLNNVDTTQTSEVWKTSEVFDAATKWNYAGQSLLNLDLLIAGQSIIIPYARGLVVGINVKTGEEQWRYDHGSSLNFAALTPRGVLLGHRREICLIGVKNEN